MIRLPWPEVEANIFIHPDNLGPVVSDGAGGSFVYLLKSETKLHISKSPAWVSAAYIVATEGGE